MHFVTIAAFPKETGYVSTARARCCNGVSLVFTEAVFDDLQRLGHADLA